MLIYDSLRAQKVEYKPEKIIKMYVCGPTVYDSAHLGHGRSAVAFDLIRRYFEFLGHEVIYVSNITDIDDKMINRANEEKITVKELADKIIPEYERDYEKLGIKKPTITPKATDFINEMITLISKLEERGYTYRINDGIYYDISKFNDYGKLSHQNLDELNIGSRVDVNEEKKNPTDFVLWKFKKNNEPSWESPWGEGRPGWHIECSAMSMKLIGESFDIHGGGLDLKFPHHECEIAQSEAVSNSSLARIWIHNGFITVNNEKMSKSLGNFFLLKDIFKKYDPSIVRFFLLNTHYRSPIEFNSELLEQSKNALRKLNIFYHSAENGSIDETLITEIKDKLDNDFDTAGAFAVINEWINKKPKNARTTLKKINEIFNIFSEDASIPEEIITLIKDRDLARKNKNFEKSDLLRKAIEQKGYEVLDTNNGTVAIPTL